MVRTSASARQRRPNTLRRSLGGALLVAVVAAVAIVGSVVGSPQVRGELMRRTGASDTRGVLTAVLRAPIHQLRAWTTANAAPRVTLDVKFKHVHTMHEHRETALRTGVLDVSDADLVPGTLEVDGHKVRTRVRLASDRPDLLEGEKWPLVLRTRGDDHLFGIRNLELRPPARAAPIPAPLLYAQLAREDVVAPRTGVVDFVWNGKAIGLMEYEEIPDAELLAQHRRRDSAILHFVAPPRFGAGAGASAIAPLRPERTVESKSFRRSFELATELVQGYLEGDFAPADVFDADLWGRYLATLDVWRADTALRWQSLRLYANPLTAKLEPVAWVAPFDGDGDFTPPDELRFARSLLRDRRIANAYEEARARIESAIRTPEFIERLEAADADRLRWLHRDYPLRLPLDAAAAFRAGRRAAPSIPDLPAEALPPRAADADTRLPLAPATVEALLAEHSFLAFDAEERELRVTAGRWDVAGSLVLPEGVGLAVPAGTTLRFEAREGLIARGPLRFEGRDDAPVVLEGPSARKPSKRWSGVYVIESRRPSRWTHVAIRNTGGFKRRGFELASGVVFRKAPVAMESCSFWNDASEDALNVVRTRFEISNIAISDAELDGFDADYSTGSISGGSISRARGDGIDLGGSAVTVRGIRIERIRDKAISVGEKSELDAEEVVIVHVGIGVAAKNGSFARIARSRMSDVTDVALVAYTNRPEYGPGVLEAWDNRFERVELPALAQRGSRLELDGRTVETIEVAINRLYKDGEVEER